MDDDRVLGDDDETVERPKLDLPADEIQRREREKKELLAGRDRGMLPDEVPGPRASRVPKGRPDAGYPDQRADEQPAPAPVEERSPRHPVTVEIAGSSPAGGATLAALAAVIRNPTLSKMPMKQYRAMLLAILDGR